MKRLFSICAALATVVLALGLLNESKPEVFACVSYDSDAKQWKVTGHVLFQRGARVRVLGWSGYAGIRRTAPFELAIPDERAKLSSTMYEPLAIQAARADSGDWEMNYLAIPIGWLMTFFTCMGVWWVFKLRQARKSEVAAQAGSGECR